MLKSSLVSVIIPVYNTEEYLIDCLESVINQTYENLEVIVINDGSNDRSGIIADEYSMKDIRINVIHKENGGASSARNIGIKYAKGKYTTFIDSDDWWEKEAIEQLVTKIEEDNADIVVPDRFTKIFSNNDCTEEYLFENYESINSVSDYVINIIISKGRAWRVSSVLYRTDLISKNNIAFPVGKVAEDVIFNLRFLLNASSIAFLPKVTLNVNKREHSVTASYRNDLPELALYIDKEIKEYLKLSGNNTSNAEIARDSLLRRNIIIFMTSEMSKKNPKKYIEKRNRILSVLKNERVNEAFERNKFIQPYWNSKYKIYYAEVMNFLVKNNFKKSAILFSKVCNSLIT